MILFKGVKVCDCTCHKEGYSVMHCVACCDLCYVTYLTKDGKIIPEILQPLLDKSRLEKVIEVKKNILKDLK